MKPSQVLLGLMLKATYAWGCTNSSSLANQTELPIVNLGYVSSAYKELYLVRKRNTNYPQRSAIRQLAIITYNFSNIRYGQPPVGNLRFRAPLPVEKSINATGSINNGSIGYICPQPYTLFNDTAVLTWALSYANGTELDLAELQKHSVNQTDPAPDPRISEDCLFLDVITPKGIFDKRGSDSGAPVLVWIYGGGYLVGEKTGAGLFDPSGLLQTSKELGDEGFVFVAMNYRLGALGFLAGHTMEAEGTPNAGLYDQRLALEWVRENIHLFGGSPDRVTIMGESAGGGSVLHQVTAFGGQNGPVPFQQVITQSAGFIPAASYQAREDVLQSVFALANVSSVTELRALPSSVLITVNNVVSRLLYQGAFHPAVDGNFVPEEFSRLILSGQFGNVRGLIGTNSDEGLLFGDPRINTTKAYLEYLRTVIPGITDSSAAYVEQKLYPPVFDGSQGYTSQFQRAYVTWQEFAFTCNQPFTSRGLQNDTHNYQFAVTPGLHSQDLGFTFYHGAPIDPAASPFPPTTDAGYAVSKILQSWIASFVTRGTPAAMNETAFEKYSNEGNLLLLGEVNGTSSVVQSVDPTLTHTRCNWLAESIYNKALVKAN